MPSWPSRNSHYDSNLELDSTTPLSVCGNPCPKTGQLHQADRERQRRTQVIRRMTLATGFQLNRFSWTVAALVALCGAEAGAQSQPLALPPGQTSRPVVKATTRPEAQRAPEPRYPSNPLYSPYGYPYRSGGAYPVAAMWIPAILMSDGTVWADFGNGYVRVQRSCREPRVIDSRGMPKAKPAPARSGAPGSTACYTRNSLGALVVTR